MTATVRLGPLFVLALPFMSICLVLEVFAELLGFAAVDVELDLNVGLEAGGAGVPLREGEKLCGEEGDAEVQLLADDFVGCGLSLENRSIALTDN
jgi:hypothetical protein